MNKGGTSNWILTLSEQFEKSGFSSQVVFGNVGNNEIEDSQVEKINFLRIPSLSRKVNLISDIQNLYKIRKVIKSEKPDVINTHTSKAGVVGRIASLGIKTKVVHTFHGHTFYGYFPNYKSKFIILSERILSLFTDHFIAVGTKVESDLINFKISSPDRISVIMPPLVLEKSGGRQSLRKLYGIDNDRFVLGSLGRITSIKRPDIMLSIAAENLDCVFLVGGGGDLEKVIRDTKLPNIVYVGWCKPENFWPACDLALLTSDNEGVPTSLVEAAGFGVSLLSKNVGSVSDILIPSVNGEFFKTINQANQIIQLLKTNSKLRSKYSKGASALVLNQFSKHRFYVEHLKVFKSLLDT
jgi:glycosyltransferase involved in cell wall biosynthesis